MALRLLALLAAARGAWRPQEELARLHGASFAAGDAWRRVELELDRSLRAYDAVPSADAAASRAAEIFARDASREPFPNFVATWDVAATGAHCRRVGRRVPCLAIAKQGGFNQTGVLIPNPYFAHVDEWDARVATWRAAIPAWDDRDPRLFWRGSVRSACGPGNVARVAALTLTAQHPDRYDVRVTHGLDAPDAKACAREFPYTKAMVDLSTGKIPAPTGGFVNASEFSRWRRYLNLPGTMGGSYSRNLNLLWPLGGAVALWDGSAVEWYYPGLRDGETHAALDEKSAGAALDALDAGEAALAAAAGAVHERFLAGGSLDRYWRLPDRPFFDETPGLGKPVAYAALDDGDPLLVACRRAKKKTRWYALAPPASLTKTSSFSIR
ncbi:hypothetical protein JL720_8814 [Aureococcus anophagefferens]|nr:hypothetical protein JL720_8814 [Aureococcus anophagefferens]